MSGVWGVSIEERQYMYIENRPQTYHYYVVYNSYRRHTFIIIYSYCTAV